MFKFIIGTVFGIAVATVGVNGIATLIDSGVEQTKSVIQKSAQ